jgi:transcriptional regulator with XRE-family HTH domain
MYQYELAQKIGVADTRISRILCGRAEATVEEQKRISRVLDISSELLFGHSDEAETCS